ncbi:MAG: TIGR01212 family radical SAM protein, partial [Bacteroidales bacterium]|nr:TIGR01212 family radical SAM protein [Bacteroidales bacterium]
MARYKNLSVFLRRYFDEKVQKISIHAGFSCPNRDGVKGFGGCTYCNNQTFSPAYCLSPKSVTEQLADGVGFFSRKYPSMKYLAYFQSYTNTYAELPVLISTYEEALRFPNIVGIIISTRPDCMPDDLLNYLKKRAKSTFILVEYGVESTNDNTLAFIKRGHAYAAVVDAVDRTAKCNIHVGAHLILGLPGETRQDILEHAYRISQLSITTVKLHQLQLVKHTQMEKQFRENPELFHFYTVNEYVDLVI